MANTALHHAAVNAKNINYLQTNKRISPQLVKIEISKKKKPVDIMVAAEFDEADKAAEMVKGFKHTTTPKAKSTPKRSLLDLLTEEKVDVESSYSSG